MKLAGLLFPFASLAFSQIPAKTPDVTNARWETRAISGDAAASLRALSASEAGPLWIGYAVAAREKDNDSCCWDERGSGCRLEGGSSRPAAAEAGSAQQRRPLPLEGSPTLLVLFRVQDHAIGKIHPVSGACPLDAGGLRFLFLTGVSTQASIAFLSEQIRDLDRKPGADAALVAIALHAGAAADQALERFAEPARPEWLREKALFWLASARGVRGLAALRQAADRDPSPTIREKVMFDLSISPEPQAIDALLHYAKYDASSRVRGQAIFWIAQKAGQRASDAITDAIANDPDTEVKKKAVFGLQQLPPGQGIPLLIQVARTNKNPEVRKQAMFWLGQSGDPRALAFFQEILGGKS